MDEGTANMLGIAFVVIAFGLLLWINLTSADKTKDLVDTVNPEYRICISTPGFTEEDCEKYLLDED